MTGRAPFLLLAIMSFLGGCVLIETESELPAPAVPVGRELAKPLWMVQSDRIAEDYTRARASVVAEIGSSIGIREFDSLATGFTLDIDDRVDAVRQSWRAKLIALSDAATDPDLKKDIRILLDGIELETAEFEFLKKAGDVPFFEASKFLYQSMAELLNEQNTADRKKAAVKRFGAYVRGGAEPRGQRPLTESMRALTEFKLKRNGRLKTVILPIHGQVADYLVRSPDLVAGLRPLLLRSGLPEADWSADLNRFEVQIRTYDNWVRTSLLPIAKKDFRRPIELYTIGLRRYGLLDSPVELASVARSELKRALVEYREFAARLADKYQLRERTPKAVLQYLKMKTEVDPQVVRRHYEKANEDLTAEIKRLDLMTLPKAPLRIRVADEAESRAQPVPHLLFPSLLGNKGERPEFVVPVGRADQLAYDDFSYPAAAKSLTAHEGRPGHDLQFSAILDRGISTIRATYAMNSVNVEGWALYAEWLMESSMGDDERLSLLTSRMMRIARMFLDPELHLGRIQPDEARRVITEDIGMSLNWANLELRRYMWDSPGQAPSYYYGYLKLRKMRDQAQARLGGRFTERCFHDRILQAGLVPLKMLEEELSQLTCQN